MSEFQKVIKYCAIAFAIVLTIGIISGIASIGFAVVNGISGGKMGSGNFNGKTIDVSKTFTDVKSLDIDNSTGTLKIMTGDEFKVEAENVSKDFEAKVNGNGKLEITDSHKGVEFLWFHVKGLNNLNSKITVYVPAGFIAREVKLDTGAGNMSVDDLQTEYLFISAGAGNISGSNLTAEEVKISGGVGNITLSNVNFTDADFDCGVGNLDIDGILLGKTKVDCGVGEVDFDLKGNIDDYGMDVDSGLGSIRLNGDKVSDSEKINEDADNMIKVDGGVGDVRIDVEE